MERQLPDGKSADSLAFEHYCRTGVRLTTAQFLAMCERKFNPNHDERGRFTFGPGFSGGGGANLDRNRSSNQPASLGSGETWTDKLRSIFGPKPASRPAPSNAPRKRTSTNTVAEIPEYPQKGKNSWRSSNDHTFIVAAAYYNHKYHLEPGDRGYKTPEFLKAWAMVESGGEDHRAAFQGDPFQVNVPGDYPPNDDSKFRIAGLRRGQKMTPGVSALAALEWLRYKGQKHGNMGRIVEHFSDEVALQNYHGRTDRSPAWGNVPRREWYARRVLQLVSQAASPHR